MKLNINDIGEEFRKVVKEIKANLLSLGDKITKGEAYQRLKNVWTKNRVNDSNFKILEIALNDGSFEVGKTSVADYTTGCVNILFERAQSKKKDAPAKKFHIFLDISKLSKMPEDELTSHIQTLFSEKGIPAEHYNSPISMSVLKKIDLPIDLSEYQGAPLLNTLVKFIKSQEHNLELDSNSHKAPSGKTDIPAHQRHLLEDGEPEKAPVKEKKEDSTEERIENIGEKSGNINYFVGYKKEEVSQLFKTKPELLDVFEEFVEKYNFIMNQFTMGNLDKEQARDFHNDILPYFHSMASACSAHGGEGSRIKNLCDGMMNILEDACSAEINGEDLDPLKTKANIEKMQLSTTDDDGKQNDSITLSGEAPEDQTFDGTYEDIEDVVEYGITRPSSRTHEGIAGVLKELEALGIIKLRALKPTV